MRIRVILGAAASLFIAGLFVLGGCEEPSRVPPPGGVNKLSCKQTPCTIPVHIAPGCKVDMGGIDEIHVDSKLGTKVEVRFVLGQGAGKASKFASNGVTIKKDTHQQVASSQLDPANPAMWVLVDANTQHGDPNAPKTVYIDFGVTVVDGNGVTCPTLDPYVVNDM